MNGGVAPNTIRACADAGAEMFVVGSALFGKDDIAKAMSDLRAALA